MYVQPPLINYTRDIENNVHTHSTTVNFNSYHNEQLSCMGATASQPTHPEILIKWIPIK